MKWHGGTLNARYYAKEAHLKRLHFCMIPIVWPSGRGETMKTVWSVVARNWGCENAYRARRWCLEQRVTVFCVTLSWWMLVSKWMLSLLFPSHPALLSRSNLFCFSRNIPGIDQHTVTPVTQYVTCRPCLSVRIMLPYSFLRSVIWKLHNLFIQSSLPCSIELPFTGQPFLSYSGGSQIFPV